MKKKLIGIFVCMLLTATVLPVSGNADIKSTSMPLLSGSILYVGGSGPGNYSTIQKAVDAASDGDTVFVYNGTYYERVQINNSINLIGEDRNTTVIDAYGEGFVIFIRSDEVSIHEFTIQNSSGINYAGIGIDFHFGFCTISDNIIIDNDKGVRMTFAGDKNTIEDNTFFNNNDCTIFGTYTNNNMILNNTIDHPPGTYSRDGIMFLYSIENNISGNTIKNCDSGVTLAYDSDYNIILNNVISSGERDGIYIWGGSSNNKIIGNNISYNLYWGIEIQEGNDNIIPRPHVPRS